MKWELPILMVAAVACFLLIRRMNRSKDDESRAAKLMKKYATLTPENLSAAPDEELVEAVVCHVLAQAEDTFRPNPVKTLAGLPQPFTVVYSIWAVCKELSRGDYHALTRTATREMVQPAIDGLPVIGAPETAAALSALRAAYEAKEDIAAADTAFHKAVETECPLSLCVAYVRDHIPQLTGTDEEAEPAALPQEPADEG